jgi:DNA-binding response OmpR family regulator
MSGAAKIIFAREDLSIPGAPENGFPVSGEGKAVEDHFFKLVNESDPDVIVLDFKSARLTGAETILTVRRRTSIPILVIADPADPFAEEYRIAGAADCVAAPVDIISLNQSIQRILRVIRRGRPAPGRVPERFSFAGMSFQPRRNVLALDDGSAVELTSSEARLLTHFVSKPWTLCTRSEIGGLLYGDNHTVGDRALDVVINRLRKKLAALGGPAAEHLIKTEFRRGYLLVSDVAVLPYEPSQITRPVLQAVS